MERMGVEQWFPSLRSYLEADAATATFTNTMKQPSSVRISTVFLIEDGSYVTEALSYFVESTLEMPLKSFL